MEYLGERVVELTELEVGKWDIRNRNGQTRSFARLRRSIKAKGIIEPLLVQERGNRLVLLDGHRRYRIAKEFGLKEVRVLVVAGSEDELKELVAVRHGTMEPYGPLAKARMAKLYRNSGMRLEEIAALLGCTRGYISDLINILALGKEVTAALENDEITIGHARLLLRVESAKREEILTKIVERGLTVAMTKALIEGRSVISWEELRRILPPRAIADRGNGQTNGHKVLSIMFDTIDELKSQVKSLNRSLKCIEMLLEEGETGLEHDF